MKRRVQASWHVPHMALRTHSADQHSMAVRESAVESLSIVHALSPHASLGLLVLARMIDQGCASFVQWGGQRMRITGLLCYHDACAAGHDCPYGGTISAWQRHMNGTDGGILAVAPIGVEGSLLVSKSIRGAEPSTRLDAREHWALTYDGVLYNATATHAHGVEAANALTIR